MTRDRPLVTCIGEVLIDFLPILEEGRTVGFRMYPGGSLLNVAMAIARLDGRVALVSKTGTDFFGRFLRRHIEREGIDTCWLGEAQASSTIGFVAFEGGEPSYTFYGEGASDTLLTIDDLPPELFAQTAILHVGSISLFRGSTPSAVVAACERLRGRALLSLDPNLRPSFVRDERSDRATLDRLFGLVDVVKLSEADAAWLWPGRSTREVAVELLARGAALVALTRGGKDVLAVRGAADAPEVLELPAFDVPVTDTVGAGDSFEGGLLTRLAELGVTSRTALAALPLDTLREALRFAAAVGALDCTREGADPPRRSEVDAFLRPVTGGRR
ncbi:MAG TPA: carbohydrate kinase [Vitreimonas sp.]|nr:carbohydrate kinase [Vitreimonas sp.]